ncbi:viperin family antiviral radical SAM protein [Sorangium sp. So ce185]|uniref:viperin family antiviral radical SAM protein n=1 Tax=Sorangium sp. So ce185 TaxID=3133287 RepID=UPI003F6140A5
MKIVAVNYHLDKPCNLRCGFCFATFRHVHESLAVADALRLLRFLCNAGCEKLTFAGGKPTLHPRFGEILAEVRRLGFVTCAVTNGARLANILEGQASDLDWLGFSIDSAREEVQAALGRGSGDYVQKTLALVDEARRRGVRIKLNTVVTRLTWEEDMSELVRRVRPARWKVFQVLPVAGQNDGSVEELLIDGDQFRAFVAHHRHLEAEALAPIAENNEAMTDSYAMIDPSGRFYGNSGGRHIASAPILDVGIEAALAQVGFVLERFAARGGVYAWESAPRPESLLSPPRSSACP